MEKEKSPTVTVEISEQEWQVIQLLRGISYGEILVAVKAHKPYRVEEIRKSIQLR